MRAISLNGETTAEVQQVLGAAVERRAASTAFAASIIGDQALVDRERARSYRGDFLEVQRGNDPDATLPWLKNCQAEVAGRAPAQGPFSDPCHRYLNDRRSFLRTATYPLYSRLIDRHIVPAFSARQPAEITRADVKEWIERLTVTPTQANRARKGNAAAIEPIQEIEMEMLYSYVKK